VEPMTKAEFQAWPKKKRQPPGNFGHNYMQRGTQSMHPMNKDATGILGRMINSVMSGTKPMNSAYYTMHGKPKILQGGPLDFPPDSIDPARGVVRYFQSQSLADDITRLTHNISRSIFQETYAKTVESAVSSTDSLADGLGGLPALDPAASFGSHGLGPELKEAARVIVLDALARNRERGAVYTESTHWDSHSVINIDHKWGEINSAISGFATEMKAKGLWDNVTLVVVSDFGRTLTWNGKGTDHGWGGNYFIAGGAVKGGQILGEFPERLDKVFSDVNIGRGRILPKFPYEAVWGGLADWWGIPEAERHAILPHMANFNSSTLYLKEALFETM
jgi:uncharacterized protein (DUF1501 family)